MILPEKSFSSFDELSSFVSEHRSFEGSLNYAEDANAALKLLGELPGYVRVSSRPTRGAALGRVKITGGQTPEGAIHVYAQVPYQAVGDFGKTWCVAACFAWLRDQGICDATWEKRR